MKINIKGPIIPNSHQWIYDLFGMDATSPGKVISLIDTAEENEEIHLSINSGGGSVFDASEIYTAIRQHSGKVVGDIVGMAASAASVIAMAADTLRMAPTAQMMIHNASTIAQGDYRDMNHTAEFLKNTNQTIANAYKLKSGKDDADLLKMMDKESWLTPQQAKEHNLIDEILFENEVKAVASSAFAGMIPPEVINKLRNELRSVNPEGSIPLSPVATNALQPNQEEGNKPMNLEQLKNDYPELYKEVKNEGFKEGVTAENSRIKAIEEIQMPGNESIINKAKYETGVQASEVAMEILKAEKSRGQNHLQNIQQDASQLNQVPGNHNPLTSANEGEQEMNMIANVIKSMNLSGGVTNGSN